MARALAAALVFLAACGVPVREATLSADARLLEIAEAPSPKAALAPPDVVVAPAPANEPSVETHDAPPVRRSAALANGLHNPMPGGVLAGYAADTGLDIAGSPRPVFALASGTLDYAEAGHTLWTGPRDTPFTVRFELDQPIAYKGRLVTHVYYGHLSKLAFVQHEGSTERRRIEAGDYVGESGVARGSPHLHIGLLLDRDVSQAWGTFLSADEIREVLGGFRNKTRLPRDPAAP